MDDILSPFGHKIENEAQAREISRLARDPNAAVRVWEEVGAANDGKHPSSALKETIDQKLGVDQRKGMDVHFSSDTDEWYTPDEIIARVERALGTINIDPCADLGRSIPATTHYTKEDDGLSKEWNGRVFMNPPYSKIGKWVEKLIKEYEEKRTTAAVVLVPARTDTEWYAELKEFPRCYIRGCVKFGDASGNARNSAPFPSVAFYLGTDTEAFVRAFENRGQVFVEWRRAVPPAGGCAREADRGDGQRGGQYRRRGDGWRARRVLQHRDDEEYHPQARQAASQRGDREGARRGLPYLEETGIDDIEIFHGAFQDVLAPLVDDKSVDLLLTDPPYASNPETLKLWEDLGVFGARVLKPDGFLVSYMGTDNTPYEMDSIRKSIPW